MQFPILRFLATALVVFAISANAWGEDISTQPSPLEVDLWRSAERVDSTESYAAYLEKFPAGYFSQMARAAQTRLAKGAVTLKPLQEPDVAKGATTATVGLPSEVLSRLSSDERNSAVSFSPGDTLVGPGAFTIGRMSWKKQAVVPSGRWVALAMLDHTSFPSQRTTIALGQFGTGRLLTLLILTTNTRGRVNTSWWPDLQACQRNDRTYLLQEVGNVGTSRYCVRSILVTGLTADKTDRGDIATAIRHALVKLDVKPADEQGVRTDVYTMTNLFDFVSVSVHDFLPSRIGQDEVTLKSRRAWTVAYAEAATLGLVRGLAIEDLIPGEQLPGKVPVLPSW